MTSVVGRMPSGSIMAFTFVEMTANIYSELREEARDHARLRNAYFEQVCLEIFSNYLLLWKKQSLFFPLSDIF